MADEVWRVAPRVDALFMDTTYALPRYTLPPQEESVRAMAQVRPRGGWGGS